MIYTTWSGRLRWSWIKNAPDVWALLTRRYPEFVYRDVDDPGDVIPVFTFHSVDPQSFEFYCRCLVEGGYRTLSTDEFAGVLEGKTRARPRSVLLTFDDGLVSLWTTAYPLLRRYGLRGTAFVVTGFVKEDEIERPTLADVWSGTTALDQIEGCEAGGAPGCTWNELREMQSSGVIDVQSHTHQHALVHVGPTIRDFVNPATDPYLIGNVNVPLVRRNGKDDFDRPLALGRPLYDALPRMAGRRRYFDDEELRRRCEELVAGQDGAMFFGRRGWRRDLRALARSSPARRGYYESQEDLEVALEHDLARSRSIIQERLGHPVHHLCYPWYSGSSSSVVAARKVGYQTNFWGIFSGRNVTRPGCDPFRVPRMACRYLPRLPGPWRKPLSHILMEHFAPGVRPQAGSNIPSRGAGAAGNTYASLSIQALDWR